MRLLRGFFYLLVLIVCAYFGLAYYVDYQLARKDFSSAYNDCHKVWTARGLYGGQTQQNSIKSIGRAFDRGALGVEVDIHYDVEIKDYIVSHSRPYRLKNGRILPLGELFDAVGAGRYFWLDFKKLRRLDQAQALEAVQRLIDISQVHGVKSRIYVEGANPTNLSYFNNAGFHTIFDTHPAPDNHFLSPFMITVYKIVYYFGDYTVMGIEYGEFDNPIYGANTRARLGNIPVFLYHLPVDQTLVDEMLRIDAVRAFIVGNNQSVDFHDKNNCPAGS
jgi:hypothetical protein